MMLSTVPKNSAVRSCTEFGGIMCCSEAEDRPAAESGVWDMALRAAGDDDREAYDGA